MKESSAHTIRPMTTADIEVVAAYYQHLDATHAERLPWLFQRPLESPRDHAFFEGILANERAAVFVAEDTGLIGFIHIRLLDASDFPIFVPQTRGMVDAIYVIPEKRRSGVAAELMLAAEAWATERGAKGMDLVVYDFNEVAGKAFAAMGYETQNRRMSKPFG